LSLRPAWLQTRGNDEVLPPRGPAYTARGPAFGPTHKPDTCAEGRHGDLGTAHYRSGDKLDGLGRELHLGFREEFRRLPLTAQGEAFRAYVADLTGAVYALDEDDPDRSGILLIQQIAEQLLPHVEAGELSLADTIVVEIGGGLQVGGSLADLL